MVASRSRTGTIAKFTGGLLAVAVILDFVVLGREQQNGPALGPWTAICRALGITADIGPAGEPQPPLRTPTEVAWTSATLTQVRAGNVQTGAALADGCVVCHGDHGVSLTSPIGARFREFWRIRTQ